MVRMEPGSIEKAPRKRGRPLKEADAAAMGKVSSPAKAAANKTKALGNKGRANRPHTPETKAKLRAAALGNQNSVGRVLPDEQKAAMDAGRADYRMTEQHKEALRAGREGYTMSDTHKAAMEAGRARARAEKKAKQEQAANGN